MRIAAATTLTALATVFTAGAASAQELDREGLIALADTYLAAIVAHDPSAAPLADDIRFVENVTRMEPGEGLWATATGGPTEFKITVPDVDLQQVGFIGMMEREHPPLPENPTEAQVASAADGLQEVMIAVRLKVEGGEIVEAEHLVQAATGDANLARLQTPRPGLLAEVPEAGRKSHDELIAIGATYYDALDDNDGSLMPFADDCQRHENGMVTAGPEAGGGPVQNPNQAPVARLCGPQLDSQSFVYIETIDNRRMIAADPVTGLAMGLSHFRHSFENLPYTVIHSDGSTSERNKENMPYNPFDMPAAHIFKIGADGLVHEIEAVGVTGIPHMAATGWE
jgi:hypothetical protein